MKGEYKIFEWCWNNHLTFGWDDGKFWFEHSQAPRHTKSFRQECIEAVKAMRNSTDKQLLINLSGGVDSEMIARSMLEAGIDFEVQIWEFNNNLNDHDISYAHKFCDEYNIKRSIIKLDIEQFLQKEIFDICEKYPTPFFAMPLQQKIVELTPDKYYSIFGEGHLIFYICNPSKEIELYGMFYKFDDPNITKYKNIPFCFEMENATNVSRFMHSKNKVGCPRFFKYTPNLMHSYITHPRFKEWILLHKMLNDGESLSKLKKELYTNKKKTDRYLHKSFTSRPRKYMFYQEFPEMVDRIKYGGLEQVEDLKIETSKKLKQLYPLHSKGTRLVAFGYDELVNKLNYVNECMI